MNIDAGNDFIVLTFALDTNATSIATTRPFVKAYLQPRGDSDVQIRRNASDSDYLTIKAGNGLLLAVNRVLPSGGATITICDARVSVGGETLEVILTL